MKYTTLLIVALLATATLAASGCDKGKCVQCAALGNDDTCLTCSKSKPALPSGVTTYMNCSGTSATGCVLTTGAVCIACDLATHFMSSVTATVNTCVVYATVKKPTDVNCTAVKTTDAADAIGLCVSCKGAFKPAAANATPVCEAVTAAVAGCTAHSAEGVCESCSAGTVTAGTPNTCTTWTATNKGCLNTACDACNYWAGYYMVSSKEPKCSMSSAILSVAGMIVALFLANF